jgi:diguanylate cyclase (GGDEF)-like protein
MPSPSRKSNQGRWRGKYPARQLGREIFVLAGFAAIVPMIVIAAVVFWQAEKILKEQAIASLQSQAARYERDLQARLLGAAGVLESLASGAELPGGALSGRIESYGVIDRSGRTVTGTLSVSDTVTRSFADQVTPKLVSSSGQDGLQIYLGRAYGEQLVVARLTPEIFRRDSEISDSAVACAFLSGTSAPLHCSGLFSQGDIDSLRNTGLPEASFSWKLGEQPYLAASSHWTSPAGIELPDMQVVVSTPSRAALASVDRLRSLYAPILGVGVALALLGAFSYSRRILHPIVRMMSVTRELTKRDVFGRADLRRGDHFSNVAHDLQHMADDLAQQFNARETLSRIDQAILSGADTSQIVDLVLQHIVESVPCRRAAVTLFSQDDSLDAIATMVSRGHPVTRTSEVTLKPESRGWLTRHADGLLLSGPPLGTPCEPFVGADTPHTYVLPILVQGEPAAAVSIMAMNEEIGTDEIQKGHVRDLAGRLAVALEVVSRSEALQRKAFFDDLTGLPNRDYCFERLDTAIKQAKNVDGAVAVMFIDLDGFKAINDSLGHIAGDELIRQAAYRLAGCIGDFGTIGRLGGDEFGVVLPFPANGTDPEDLAERVLESINQPFRIATSEIHMSASVGVARYPEDGDTRVELLRKADTAMYSAKEAGRGRKIDYSSTMGIKVDERMRLEGELRRALENDELRVYYQPQIEMRTGRITSAEALLRWNHPERGLVMPGEFVPIAEDSGFINVLGGWIMSAACKQLCVWKDQCLGIARVSVNVSAGQFRRTDFIDVVESSLFELQFESQALEIELTERVFVEDITLARKTLERLKDLGVVVSIDDFGTGYSSLGYLKHLTFDAVKVDQSFVHELPGDRESEAIVRSVLAMCHTLGKQVVAEGIESDEQFEFLREAGVDIGQGFRIGRPMTAAAFEQYVKDTNSRLDAEQSHRLLA